MRAGSCTEEWSRVREVGYVKHGPRSTGQEESVSDVEGKWFIVWPTLASYSSIAFLSFSALTQNSLLEGSGFRFRGTSAF